ncbi:hypothetical protein B6D29_04590 [Microgenomates bacterium UTCPR1]|nr:DUF2294 domain-containing protein [Patescibacteria group bacterium]OQY64986.1 MAG: hypothetical protein B6D29_04590 [Microgenomates bacterium UTCPR1]
MDQSKGQIEDVLAKKATVFYREVFGVGPKEAKSYILDDMIIIRLLTNLLPIEKKLLTKYKGVELVKNLRQNLHDATINEVSKIIKEITGQTIISAHSDISTKTGEIFEVFILNENYEDKLKQRNL